ncbi:hypothetical protein ITJ66_07925 [Plantibacter sp. VKM Ac-2885]|nr:hypothetical protein [Plantibacter sp. VKM Ac-2885]
MLRPAHGFSVRDYAKSAVGSRRKEIDAAAFSETPLSAETVALLRALSDIERATMQYLRGVLVTPTHKDARVTAFLITWAYEKYWITDTLDTVLKANGTPRDKTRSTGLRRTVHGVRDRFAPIGQALVANVLGEDIIAWHMTIGTIDDLITHAAYRAVREREPHPVLDRLVDEILETKARHLEFFTAQASDRLAASPRAQGITRRRIRNAVWPTGSDANGPRQTARFAALVFRSTATWSDPAVLGIDASIDALPGQSGLHLAARLARRGRRGSLEENR